MEAPYEDSSTRLEMDAGIIEENDDFQKEERKNLKQTVADDFYNAAEAWDKLKKTGLELPVIILSIFMDVENAFFDDDVKQAFQKGLAKIISTTNTWLLIGPTETAVSLLAETAFATTGDLNKLKRNACIRILSSLEMQYSPSNDRDKFIQRYIHTLHHKAVCKFVPEFEQLLASLDKQDEAKVTPVVSILVHGGVKAFEKLKENMKGYPCIPVVIVKGSGGLADIIADALAAYNQLKMRGRQLHSRIEYFLGQSSLPDHSIIVDHVKDFLEAYSQFMIVYDFKRDPFGLHRAVIECCKVLSGQTQCTTKGMRLAVGTGDIMKFKSDILRSDHFVRNEVFHHAIGNGRADFVKFFLSYSDELQTFVMSWFHRLCIMNHETNEVFKALMEEEAKKEEKKIAKKKKNKKLKEEDFELPSTQLWHKEKFNLKLFDTLLESLMERDFVKCFWQSQGEWSRMMTATQKLIFWSIFNNMPKLVDCFWEYESDKAVENAVIIFRVAKSLSHYTVLSETARKGFGTIAEEYEKRAVDVLTCYYQTDTEAAIDIVKRRIPLWGNKSILTIAANSGSREIVSHPSCQEYLTDIWNGKRDETSIMDDGTREGGTQVTKQTCFDMFRSLFCIPKGKLFLHELLFTIFLGCFSFIVLVKKGKYHDPLRYTVFTIVTALAIDEIREVLEIKKDTMLLKLKEWVKSVWNRLDVIALVLFYIAFAFGFYDHKTAERSMMAIDLVLWVIKFAQFYRTFYSLGLYLIMIYKMMFHMAGFLLVLVIAVFAYGIFMHTLLFPDETVSWKILFKVLFRPYLLAFGELGMEKHDLSKDKTIYGTPKISESTEIIVVIGMCIYLLVANVLMINMLIAVFNNIYEDIKENSDKIWRFDKYDLIMEFERKPSAPIPFSIIPNIIRIFWAIRALIKSKTAEDAARDRARCYWRLCTCCSRKCKNKMSSQTELKGFSVAQMMDLETFQARCMEDYLREKNQKPALNRDVFSNVKKSDHLPHDGIELNEILDICAEILARLHRKDCDGELS